MVNVINAIEETLQAQKDAIFFKDLQIEELKKKLAAAESEIADLKNEVAAAVETVEIYFANGNSASGVDEKGGE